MTYQLGVDLGTTFTAAAVLDGGITTMATLGVRQPEMPSVIAVGDNELLIGDAAEHHGRTNPQSVARFFKRRFGDSTPLVVRGQPWSAEALSARLLGRVLEVAGQREGSLPSGVVLTHPAGWREFKVDAMHSVAQLASLQNYHLVPEPVAAARHYAQLNRLPSQARLAVFDFGGGTFDTSVVATNGDDFSVVGTPGGVNRLGGIDLDEAVFAHVCETVGVDPYEIDDTEDTRRALWRLRRECRDAKEMLSTATTVTISVILPGINTEVELTRAAFEAMLAPVLDDAGQTVDATVRSAGLSIDEIDAVLLVGGSSQIPVVRDFLSDRFGRPVLVDTHPKHAVALGAARMWPGAATPAATPPGVVPPVPAAPVVEPPITPPQRPVPAPAPPSQEAQLAHQAAARAETRIEQSVPVSAAAAPSSIPAARPRVAGTASRRPFFVVLGGLVIALAGGLGYFAIQGGDDGGDAVASPPVTTVVATTITEPSDPVDDGATPAPDTTEGEVELEEEPSPASEPLGDGSLGTIEVGVGEQIQIRSIQAISGDVSFLGLPNQRATQLAVDDYGQIQGFSVDVGPNLDGLCSADGGQAAAQTVVADEQVVGVIGTSCSGSASAAGPILTEAGMVMISPSNTSPALTSDLAGNPGENNQAGYHRVANNDIVQGQALAHFVFNELGHTTAAAIHDGDPYTESLANAFATTFTQLGGEVTTIAVIDSEGANAEAVLADVAALRPAAIFLPVFDPAGSALVGQIPDTAGIENASILTSDALLYDGFLEQPLSEGMWLSGPDLNFGTSQNQATGRRANEVLQAYETTYGEQPAAAFWAHSYDATTLLLDAIAAASTVEGDTLIIDRAGVREYLSTVTGYSGLTGTLSCDEFGDCGSTKTTIVRHDDSTDVPATRENVVFTFPE